MQTTKRVRTLDAKAKRRERGNERQTKVSSNSSAANAFLKHTFLPKLPVRDFNEAIEMQDIERDFYESLSQLAQHYSIDLMSTRNYTYPYNISLALWDVKGKLKQVNQHWNDLKLIQDGGKSFLISEECFGLGYNLYYIPVQPLYEMLKDPKRRNIAQLLVSVCSYLYKVADVPYYLQEDSYMYWQYEMIADMEDEQAEEYDAIEEEYEKPFSKELKEAKRIGKRMENEFIKPKNLCAFERRVKRFSPADEYEIECQKLASQAYALYKEYSKASIFRHEPVQDDSEEDYYDESSLRMNKCISFIANGEGPLFDCLCEYINHELNEYSEADEPTIVKRFDGSSIYDGNFDFEIRIFDVLDSLAYLLNNYQFQCKKT